MKVLLINGSPNREGCTYTALSHVAAALESECVESEMIWLGNKPVQDCISCEGCRKTGKCVFDDPVNEIVEKAKTADGFVFGTPVYYAHPSGRLLSALDRMFFSGSRHFRGKPGAAICSARRGGTTASLDAVNKHFTIAEMPLVSSSYWNMVHGTCPDEVLQDAEGLQTMANLGRNMAWLLKCIEAGKAAGIERPKNDYRAWTNFVR